MKILHIHQDYPDGRAFPSTKAVYNLIAASEQYNPDISHYVLSIKRTSNPLKISIKSFEQGLSVVYWALPMRFIYKPVIWFWSILLNTYLRNMTFDVIHSHKLTTEGLFGFFLSKSMKLPYLISVRGGSDINNLLRLPDCRKTFRYIYVNAKHIFWISPWAKFEIDMLLDCQTENNSLFPNICHIDYIKAECHTNRKRYCTILSFHQVFRKGILPLLGAIAELKHRGVDISLDIIGSGAETYKKIICKEIKRLDLNQNVKLIGQLDHSELLHNLSESKALLLPAVSETFGMVYIEALACGTPILYMAGTGIDGHLDNISVGVKLQEQSTNAIVDGICELEENYLRYQSTFKAINSSNYLIKFTGQYIANQYTKILLGSEK